MSDEFIKGFGIFVTAGLAWMTLAGWYNTPGFEERQLTAPDPAMTDLSVYGQFAVILKDALFWFAILGALTFWVVIPAYREARRAYAGEAE